jgi:thiamine-phosphate pyrophosphorylase
MRLCAITDRKCLGSAMEGEAALGRRLRELTAAWIRGGVDFVQIREKDLEPLALRRLAEGILAEAAQYQSELRRPSKLLINLPASHPGIRELAPVADGIHIPGRPVAGAAESVRERFQAIGRPAIVSLSCHTLGDVRIAREEKADLVLFAPVFDKPASSRESLPGTSGQGLGMLKYACEAAGEMPIFALGGVTAANASLCVSAGVAGVAGIRLFAGDDWQLLRE